MGEELEAIHKRDHNLGSEGVAGGGAGLEAVKESCHSLPIVGAGEGEGSMDVPVGCTIGGDGGFGQRTECLPVDLRHCVRVEHHSPYEGCGVGEGPTVPCGDGGLNTAVVEVQDLVVMALGELEEAVVPRQVDVEGGTAVVVFGPFFQELCAVTGRASFEEDVSDGVGSVGVVGTGLEGSLGEAQGLVENARLVVGEGIAALECPVIAVVRSHLATKGELGCRITL